jgi:hypothetical protein
MTEIDHMQDGVGHINVAPNGKTELGRLLYIGALRPFVDPQYGYFASIVAFWVWYDSGQNDSLREIHHDNMIRSSFSGLPDLPGNRAEVIEVLKRSIDQDPKALALLENSSLPLVCYETINYEGRAHPVSYELTDREWYVNALETIRQGLHSL